MDYVYKTENVCSMEIHFHIEDNIITNIVFTGGCNGNLKAISKILDGWTVEQIEAKLSGCNGNLKAISKILDGWTVEQIEAKLKGNTCGRRPTSCADQLAIAVRKAYNEINAA